MTTFISRNLWQELTFLHTFTKHLFCAVFVSFSENSVKKTVLSSNVAIKQKQVKIIMWYNINTNKQKDPNNNNWIRDFFTRCVKRIKFAHTLYSRTHSRDVIYDPPLHTQTHTLFDFSQGMNVIAFPDNCQITLKYKNCFWQNIWSLYDFVSLPSMLGWIRYNNRDFQPGFRECTLWFRQTLFLLDFVIELDNSKIYLRSLVLNFDNLDFSNKRNQNYI